MNIFIIHPFPLLDLSVASLGMFASEGLLGLPCAWRQVTSPTSCNIQASLLEQDAF